MRFSRARYVTLCQQSLVTAAVLAVGLSAAGVKTLDIVPQPGDAAGPNASAPANGPDVDSAGPRQVVADGGTTDRTEVDTAPVTPKVREVAVTSAPSKSAARQVQPKQAPVAPEKTKVQPRTVESAPE